MRKYPNAAATVFDAHSDQKLQLKFHIRHCRLPEQAVQSVTLLQVLQNFPWQMDALFDACGDAGGKSKLLKVIQYATKLIAVSKLGSSPRFALIAKNISLSRAVGSSFDSVEAIHTLAVLASNPNKWGTIGSFRATIDACSDVCKLLFSKDPARHHRMQSVNAGTDLSTAERVGILPSLPGWLERSTDCLWAASLALSMLHSLYALGVAVSHWKTAQAQASCSSTTTAQPAVQPTNDAHATSTSGSHETDAPDSSLNQTQDTQDAIYSDLDVSMATAGASSKEQTADTLAQAQHRVLIELINVAKIACDLTQALPCALERPLDKRVDAAAGLLSSLLAMWKLVATHE